MPSALEAEFVPLPGGRVLTVRPVDGGDLHQLEALYDGLSIEDRYFRFFSGFVPPRSLIRTWVHPEEHGGYRLIAELDGRIVADAGYAPTHGGDADVDITVEHGSRGWLGPYLLDRLVAAARERGMRNLVLDILTTNRRMLALVRARGYVVLDHDDAAVTRVAIGVVDTMPVWRERDGRTRLVVETRAARWSGANAARAAGYEIIYCPGPMAGPRPHCPAVEGRPCPLAADADRIVHSLGLGHERYRRLRRAHETLHPGVPVEIERR